MWPGYYALWDLACSAIYFHSLLPLFSPPTSQSVTAPARSLYTPLSPCHHPYTSFQVELASFSPSCSLTSKNKAPLCRAAARLQPAPPRGRKLPSQTPSQGSRAELSDCLRADLQLLSVYRVCVIGELSSKEHLTLHNVHFACLLTE